MRHKKSRPGRTTCTCQRTSRIEQCHCNPCYPLYTASSKRFPYGTLILPIRPVSTTPCSPNFNKKHHSRNTSMTLPIPTLLVWCLTPLLVVCDVWTCIFHNKNHQESTAPCPINIAISTGDDQISTTWGMESTTPHGSSCFVENHHKTSKNVQKNGTETANCSMFDCFLNQNRNGYRLIILKVIWTK